MPTIIRVAARAGIGFITLPVSITIDRYIFRKSGPNIGTIILLFVFINFYWVLPLFAYHTENFISLFFPTATGFGKETAAVLIIFLGNYFYWLPAGCLIFMIIFIIQNHGRKESIYSVYKMFEYLLIITPVSVAVYTMVCYQMLRAFRYIPHIGNNSFFYPVNFNNFWSFYFPVAESWDSFNATICFSLYGILAGVVSSVRVWGSEINSRRRLYRESVREYLSNKSGKQKFYGIIIVYSLVMFWLILLPLFVMPHVDYGEKLIRVLSFAFLMLPLSFGTVLRIYRMIFCVQRYNLDVRR